MSALHGNLAELDRIAADIRRRGAAVAQIPGLALPAVRAAQAAQIASRKTPYGEPWAPTKDGGEAKADIAARVTLRAEGATLVTETDDVAGFHHSGTSRMPARPLIPTESRAIPETWRKALDAASDKAMGERGAR